MNKRTVELKASIQGASILIDEMIHEPCTDVLQGAAQRHYRQVLDTKDALVREALIKLGWTPPPETPSVLHSRRDKPTGA